MTKLIKQIMDDLFKPIMEDVFATPLWMRWAVIVVTCAATIPLAIIFRARSATSDKPKIHIIQNMDNQPKFVSQEANALFLDGRAMRPRILGTIAQNGMTDDTHMYMGIADGAWVTTYPPSLTIDRTFIERGQERFNIYCSPCHGKGGFGDGLVHHRAQQLVETGVNGTSWVAPKNLHEDAIQALSVGELFNTITNGARTMSGYASQIPTQDRWAIISYIEALQISQNANPDDIAEANSLPRNEAPKQGGKE
jgi:mono/diheme cytochrome c family protein